MKQRQTIYSSEPVLFLVERSWNKLIIETLAYQHKGWEVFDPPFNVVFEKELVVGAARNRADGKGAYLRRKENVGKEQKFYSLKSNKKAAA